MKCSFCGTENAPGRTHCIACGTALPVNENNLMATGPMAGGGVSEPAQAAPIPTPVPAPEPSVPPPSSPSSPRVEVQYAPQEVAEVEMPTSQIQNVIPATFVGSVAEPAALPTPPVLPSPSSAPSPTSSPILPPEQGRPGPWLALTVLGVGLVVIVGIIYFGYQLIFGGGSSQPTAGPIVTPTTTTAPTVTPTPTPTTVPVLPTNDVQREKDITDIQAALEKYFTDKGKYPKATNYTSMLNSLISGQYLTRRVQDPLFPSQQYQYTVDPDQKAYELVVQFETNLSTLLTGGNTVYRFSSPAQN